MTAALLSVHVLLAIVCIGPITVVGGMFPAFARRALVVDADSRAVGALQVLLRISRVYAVVALGVPVFGVATAVQLDVLTDAWLLVSIALTAAAAALFGLRILPIQAALTAAAGTDAGPAVLARRRDRTLAMTTGVFSLLWAVVVVLMIVRPGSTTGV